MWLYMIVHVIRLHTAHVFVIQHVQVHITPATRISNVVVFGFGIVVVYATIQFMVVVYATIQFMVVIVII
jgi:hypothetical protein